MLLLKTVVIALVTLVSAYGFAYRYRLLKSGCLVEGRITYLEGKREGYGANPLITFSYTVAGQRYHKGFHETLYGASASKGQGIARHYAVGDSIPVWHATSDPDVCCLGGPPQRGWPSVRSWLKARVPIGVQAWLRN